MILHKTDFFTFMLMCYAVCFPSDDVFALTASSCHNGGEYQYCGFGRSCKACPENCYCPPRSDAKTESCTGWTGIWCDATNHKIKSNTNAGIGEGSFGIKICPDSYPFSDTGSKSIEDCYAKVGGKRVYNKSVKLEPGKYLPINSDTAAKCKTDGNRYYCPGGTFHTNLTKDVGLKECPSNKIANSQKSSCIDSTTYCQAGQYLPKNATKCTSCKSGRYYVCVGGTFPVYASSDQGIRKCDANLIADSGHKQCVIDTSSSTSKTTTTKITLTKNQMKFGFKGSTTPVESQCWTKYKNKGEYISCVMKRYY